MRQNPGVTKTASLDHGPPRASDRDPEPRGSVLLVGDSGYWAEDVRVALEEAGHELRAVREGMAALAALESAPADVIVIAGHMPGLDTSALCRAIRERPEIAPPAMIVVRPRFDGTERPLEPPEGCTCEYLTEPVAPGELLIRIRSGLEEARMGASEARLSALIANVPGAIYRCANDPDWTMELISEEIERISGYPPEDFIQSARRTYASVIHPDDRETVERDVAAATEGGEPFSLEYRIVRADGTVTWVLERGQLGRGPGGRTWLDGFIFDITDRRRAEAALRRREAERARIAELRASRARIVAAGDAERRRVVRDLHDGAQQQLVALMLTLQLARKETATRPEHARKCIDEAVEKAQAAIAQLRELAAGIHPTILTNRGLGGALEALASRSPVPVELETAFGERLPWSVEAAAYFVVAEALTNVAKYAAASHATVRVTRNDDHMTLEVLDDGVGGADPAEGTGLRGMGDRVSALDGELEVESENGRGTLIRARLPLGE